MAARATYQASDKNHAVGMTEETIGNTGVVPREVSADACYYSGKVVDQLNALGVGPFIAPEQTRHGRMSLRRPEDAYPVISSPGTECDGSYRPSGAASATPYAWKRWSRSSARSGNAEASGNS